MGAALDTSAFSQGFAAGIRPEKPVSLVAWSDEKRVLSNKASAEPGKWRTSRVPFMAEIMESLSVTSTVQTVALMKGAQIAGTEVGNNFVGYVIDHAPAPMMVVQPTIDMGKRWSRQRFSPMVEDMPVLKEKVADARSRDSGTTQLLKDFDGGILIISGANSASSLRSMPVRHLFLDEVDGYPLDVDGEGDPVELAINRTKTFGRKKVFMPSTPTTAGVSRIEQEFKAGDQRYYHVPCPHCDGYQKLEWKNIRWQKEPEHRPDTAILACVHCGSEIEEHHKPSMLARGRWIPENPKAPAHRRSYHLNSLYSPLGWESWTNIVEKFLEAQGNIEKLKTWTNTQLAETWKEQVNDIQPEHLRSRAEPYALGTVPQRALVLTAGVDVQDNRLECSVYGWGRNEEGWLVHDAVIYGDPSERATWDQLEAVLWESGFQHAGGSMLYPEVVAVDSGGHHTHEVYAWCRDNQSRGVIAIKGSSKHGQSVIGRPSYVDINLRGRVVKKGVKLWSIGTDTAKSTLYSRFMKTPPDAPDAPCPGYMHFSDELPLEFFEQITAEKLAKRYRKGFEVYEWVKQAAQRNEKLDCAVYAYAAALHPKVHIHTKKDAEWRLLEETLNPRTGDLFQQPVKASRQPRKPHATAPQAGRSSGFGSQDWNL